MNGGQKVVAHVVWALALLGITVAVAQQKSPDAVNGCVYNSSPPTLTDKQTTPFQCDSAGRLLVK